MLFSPARALHITLMAVRENPEHAEGIILGMVAAVEGYEALIGESMRDTEQEAREDKPASVKPTRPAALARAR